MSYDVYVLVPAGGRCDACGRYGDHNYTYNVSSMFARALGGDGLNGLNGMGAEKAAGLLRIAIADMEAHPEVYEPMNPPNGWGDYRGAIEFLRKVKKTCVKHPDGEVRIS